MEKKYKRIPFDLELAKAITKGEKEGRVVTRANKPISPYNEQTKHLLGTTDDWEG